MTAPTPKPNESQHQYIARAIKELGASNPQSSNVERTEAAHYAWDKANPDSRLEQLAKTQYPEDKYDYVRSVAVFSEHMGHDHDGGQRQYTKADLQKIVDCNNHRILDTQQFVPISDGHTPTPEMKNKGISNPKIMAWAGNYRMGMIGDENPRWAIFQDEYRKKENADYFRSHPRRSVEIWLHDNIEDRFFDPVAALGSETPKLELPMKFSRQSTPIEHYEMGATLQYSFAGADSVHVSSTPARNKPEPNIAPKERFEGEIPVLTPEQFTAAIQSMVDEGNKILAMTGGTPAMPEHPEPPAPQPNDPMQAPGMGAPMAPPAPADPMGGMPPETPPDAGGPAPPVPPGNAFPPEEEDSSPEEPHSMPFSSDELPDDETDDETNDEDVEMFSHEEDEEDHEDYMGEESMEEPVDEFDSDEEDMDIDDMYESEEEDEETEDYESMEYGPETTKQLKSGKLSKKGKKMRSSKRKGNTPGVSRYQRENAALRRELSDQKENYSKLQAEVSRQRAELEDAKRLAVLQRLDITHVLPQKKLYDKSGNEKVIAGVDAQMLKCSYAAMPSQQDFEDHINYITEFYSKRENEVVTLGDVQHYSMYTPSKEPSQADHIRISREARNAVLKARKNNEKLDIEDVKRDMYSKEFGADVARQYCRAA